MRHRCWPIIVFQHSEHVQQALQTMEQVVADYAYGNGITEEADNEQNVGGSALDPLEWVDVHKEVRHVVGDAHIEVLSLSILVNHFPWSQVVTSDLRTDEQQHGENDGRRLDVGITEEQEGDDWNQQEMVKCRDLVVNRPALLKQEGGSAAGRDAEAGVADKVDPESSVG